MSYATCVTFGRTLENRRNSATITPIRHNIRSGPLAIGAGVPKLECNSCPLAPTALYRVAARRLRIGFDAVGDRVGQVRAGDDAGNVERGLILAHHGEIAARDIAQTHAAHRALHPRPIPVLTRITPKMRRSGSAR